MSKFHSRYIKFEIYVPLVDILNVYYLYSHCILNDFLFNEKFPTDFGNANTNECFFLNILYIKWAHFFVRITKINKNSAFMRLDKNYTTSENLITAAQHINYYFIYY